MTIEITTTTCNKGLVDPERKWKRPYLAWVRSDILEAEVANA